VRRRRQEEIEIETSRCCERRATGCGEGSSFKLDEGGSSTNSLVALPLQSNEGKRSLMSTLVKEKGKKKEEQVQVKRLSLTAKLLIKTSVSRTLPLRAASSKGEGEKGMREREQERRRKDSRYS